MDIKRSGSQPSGKGPAEYFTGIVRIDPLFQVKDPARAAGNSVTFEPGARTAWHTHPLGQTLIVTAGCGRAQSWGGPIEEIRHGERMLVRLEKEWSPHPFIGVRNVDPVTRNQARYENGRTEGEQNRERSLCPSHKRMTSEVVYLEQR